ncbi:TniQ family protein [Rhodococcus sp. IEGM 1241]|uniref:TniQ family protein n=1 Tax=Rhodococcus sp. IEGM 1241 TaxID=3082228 RepID=UPI0029555555|nr:TniQ family protein [Rhodococcus sp. IEGM 1241]MDV8015512.1 TniQ family protein [Rhodococcus sp. IEGM 1241]
MTPRWPVHPAPIPGEALTSWLARIAHKYGISVDILASDLGYAIGRDDDLDLAPPAGFAEKVADRTGVAVADIRAMTISGHTPGCSTSLNLAPTRSPPTSAGCRSSSPRGHAAAGR